jgi:hypothetical protein
VPEPLQVRAAEKPEVRIHLPLVARALRQVEAELEAQEALFPREEVLPFGPEVATRAAALYRRPTAPCGREVNLTIAARAATVIRPVTSSRSSRGSLAWEPASSSPDEPTASRSRTWRAR